MVISALKNGLFAATSWSLGFNNLSAIGEVLRDEYQYNDFDDKSFTLRAKQTGTELLHTAGKWTSIGLMADRALTSFHLLPKPHDCSLRGFAHQMRLPDLSYLTSENLIAAAGVSSLAYTSLFCLKDLTQGLASVASAFGVNYDGQYIFDARRFREGIGHFLNIAVAIPVFTSYNNHGLAGAAVAGSLFYIVKKYDGKFPFLPRRVLKTAFLVAGLAAQ